MRWVWKLAGVLVGAQIAFLAALALVPAERIADLAARELTAFTGREVLIDGPVKTAFSPYIGVRTGRITIGNAAWGREGAIVEAEKMEIGVDLGALFRGRLRLRALRLTAPRIHLERDGAGRGNWDFPALRGAGGNTPGRALTAESLTGLAPLKVSIRGGRVDYRRAASGRAEAVSEVDLTLFAGSRDGALRFHGAATRAGERVGFSGQLAPMSGLEDGRTAAASLRLKGGIGKADISGRVGLKPLRIDADFAADLRNLPRILAMAGLKDYPLGEIEKRGRVKTRLTYTGGSVVNLRGIELGYGRTEIGGDVDIDLAGRRPAVVANLKAARLDLAPQDGEGSATKKAVRDRAWPRNRLPTGFLSALDGAFALDADRLYLGAATLGPVRIGGKLEDGRLLLRLRDSEAYGGTLEGHVAVNARTKLAVAGNITAKGVALKPLLGDFAGYEGLDAPGDAHLDLLAVGDSVDALMHSLAGSARFEIGEGTLSGLDLAATVRRAGRAERAKGGTSVFRAVSGSFRLGAGVAEGRDLVLRSEGLTARGDGRIDFGARRVDFRLSPLALADIDPKGAKPLGVPIVLAGPWERLRIRVDLEGLFDARIKAQQAKAQQKLRTEAARSRAEAGGKLKKDLDKALQDGGGKVLEDALRRLRGQ